MKNLVFVLCVIFCGCYWPDKPPTERYRVVTLVNGYGDTLYRVEKWQCYGPEDIYEWADAYDWRDKNPSVFKVAVDARANMDKRIQADIHTEKSEYRPTD
jgi:hypothetical protein